MIPEATSQHLHAGWTVHLHAGDAPEPVRDRSLPATVPGCVHSDLFAAGLIPDPLLERNESEMRWIGLCDWRYRLDFAAAPAVLACDRVELVCDGLDTVAEIRLNGRAVARTRNMHRGHRFDVTGLLGDDDSLEVVFRSALRHAEALRDELGVPPDAHTAPFELVRKMACGFGADPGPTLSTAGIWQPVRLEGWNVARIASFRPLVALEDGHAEIAIEVDLDWIEEANEILELEARLIAPGGAAEPAGALAEIEAQQRRAFLRLRVDDPQLWWPRGHGAQPRYDLELNLSAGIGEAARRLDSDGARLGLRRVRLDPGGNERAATLVVNERPLVVRAADWVPDDPLVTRVDPAGYRERIGRAVAADTNLLRVWGGGIYERDAFYDICDELGMLVWQDLPFACAACPEGGFRSEVETEARQQAARLGPHPSLVLWGGGDIPPDFRDWGARAEIGERRRGQGFYLALLRRLVAELDPGRPVIGV